MVMLDNLSVSKIKKEYKSMVSVIPEDKLKELFDALYYGLYYSIFIEEDTNVFDESLELLDTLMEYNDPLKVVRAFSEAMVCVPLRGSLELHKKLSGEIRERTAMLYTLYYTSLLIDLELYNGFIGCINHVEVGDERKVLDSIRKDMVQIVEIMERVAFDDKSLRNIEGAKSTLKKSDNNYDQILEHLKKNSYNKKEVINIP